VLEGRHLRRRSPASKPDASRKRIPRADESARVHASWDTRPIVRGKNQEQQLQGPRKGNQDKTDSYGLDRRYVIPQAKFGDPFPDQNVKAPGPITIIATPPNAIT
jgi:hypothetical protein